MIRREIVEVVEHIEIDDPISSANITIHDDGKEGTRGAEHSGDHGDLSGEFCEEKEDDEERKIGGGDFKIEVHEEEELKEEEIICRICHMSCCSEPIDSQTAVGGGSELIKLGCQCRGELGMSHLYCAETWFNLRANSACEICGATAMNVKITKKPAPTRIWIVDFGEIRHIQNQGNSMHGGSSSRRESSLCRQSCCNLLFVCVLLCLIFPWFLRV